MPKIVDKNLDLLLIADDAYRVAMLRRAMHQVGLSCTIRRLAQTKKASAYLGRVKPYQNSPLPDLVFFDIADSDPSTVEIAKDIAFGERRSKVPVVLLTSPASETLLESGELDGGATTMFSPRTLETFLKKLVGRRRYGFLRALSTLYQYGPILARQPLNFLEHGSEPAELSA
ncbi:MAG: hypothetical protein OER97_06310 [Gammaproteobacteria bacterium]|nr:hypothetical protein [Gammaproteobacteria bacterium]